LNIQFFFKKKKKKIQVGLNQEGGLDVYNFLHMVNSGANEEESNTACLGAEIDDIVLEDEYTD
jgi:DNA-directed RNA polymerase-5 subunit 1